MLILPFAAARESLELIPSALASAAPPVLRRAWPSDLEAWAAATHTLAHARTRESIIARHPCIRVAGLVWRAPIAADPTLADLHATGWSVHQVVQEAITALSLDGAALVTADARGEVLAPADPTRAV